ncbi:DUF6220 domain-containing protein [Paenibacillus thermotolerans]|uniref:DUF6220 domain-containing protein n=1 Tax=Paenibacillus thermotolerans TaxID=3027807 RepID=UPI0023682E71|nr:MULTISPECIES: DUF6220 domain-containing protein [unclassified Paenibacillus]
MKFSRYAFFTLAWILLACIVVQTLLAGMAVFSDPLKWRQHISFVHLFEFVPIVMLILAFTGRLPKRLIGESAGLFVLIFVQYFTANFPAAGAVHPVIALLLFGLSLHTGAGAWRALKGGEAR